MDLKFKMACLDNDLAYVKSNVDKIALHKDKYAYFTEACLRGNFEIAEILYKKGCKVRLEEARKVAEDFRFNDVVVFLDRLIQKEQLKEKLHSI